MSQATCRLTVLGPGGRADLALPAASPLGTYLPDLIGRCGGAPYDVNAAGWVLARAQGQPLPPAATLGESGVLDGEILYLTPPGVAPASGSCPDPPVETPRPPLQRPVQPFSAPSLKALFVAAGALMVSAVIAAAAALAGLPFTGATATLGVGWVVIVQHVVPRLTQPEEAARPGAALVAGGAVVAVTALILGCSGQPYSLGLAAALIIAFGLYSWRLVHGVPLPAALAGLGVIAEVALVPLLLGALGIYSLVMGG